MTFKIAVKNIDSEDTIETTEEIEVELHENSEGAIKIKQEDKETLDMYNKKDSFMPPFTMLNGLFNYNKDEEADEEDVDNESPLVSSIEKRVLGDTGLVIALLTKAMMTKASKMRKKGKNHEDETMRKIYSLAAIKIVLAISSSEDLASMVLSYRGIMSEYYMRKDFINK